MILSGDKQVRLSIVIAAWNGISSLRECLSSLESQIETAETEVIVVSNFESGISEIKLEFPFAGYFVLSPETNVPQLRTRGVFESRGAVIALIEDLCTVDCNWVREIEKAHNLPYVAVGGAVENTDGQNPLDWAVYFYDYGKYMPPNRAGVTDTLSGMNVSYKRETLERVRQTYETGFFETFTNEELKRRGRELYLAPSAIVYHNKNYHLKKTIVQFYHQARSFAARRVANIPFSKRVLFIIASLVLPILLPLRIILRVVDKGHHFKELLKSLPYLTLLTSVWAFGEFCGYLKGAGQSDQYWK